MSEDTGALSENDHPTKNHLIVLVHGINTRAGWMGSIGPALESNGFLIAPTTYGRFSIIRFLMPFDYFKKRPVERVIKDIRSAIYLSQPENVSIIAHSFGTYVVSKILQDVPELKWHRIIFCGSVVRDDYPLNQVIDRFDTPLLNDIGSKDYWPAIAESVGWDYGSIGSNGLNRPGSRTRYHEGFKHSDFLTEGFCQKYWVPFLKEGKIVKASEPFSAPWWIELLTRIPIKWLIAAVPFLLIVPLLYGLSSTGDLFARDTCTFNRNNLSDDTYYGKVRFVFTPNLIHTSKILIFLEVSDGKNTKTVQVDGTDSDLFKDPAYRNFYYTLKYPHSNYLKVNATVASPINGEDIAIPCTEVH